MDDKEPPVDERKFNVAVHLRKEPSEERVKERELFRRTHTPSSDMY